MRIKNLIIAAFAFITLAACDQDSQQGLGGMIFGALAAEIIREAVN